MFKTDPDLRLHLWFEFRASLESSATPLEDTVAFWDEAPRIAYNNLIDQHYDGNWPTPWEIIDRNKYDDFTLGIMIGYTLKLTEKFANSKIELRTMVDENRTKLYNLIYIDDNMVLNFDKWKAIQVENIPNSFLLENLVDITRPR